jgi:hypothetical protein
MLNSHNTQETVFSPEQIDSIGDGSSSANSGDPSQQETSLRAKLSGFEEVCLSALDRGNMQEVRKEYTDIIHLVRSEKDDFGRRQDLPGNPSTALSSEVSTAKGLNEARDHEKESEERDLALLNARTLFNDTSDLMKINVLEALKRQLDCTTKDLPESTAVNDLRNVSNRFVLHASRLNGATVKLVFKGWDGDSFKWLHEHQADRFVRQSHFAFEEVLREMDAEQDNGSEDQDLTKSVRAGLEDLSRLGDNVLEATFVRLKDEKTFRAAPMYKLDSIEMSESEYRDMTDRYDRAHGSA